MTNSGESSFAKTVCSICYEDLKPLLEDLQAISLCGHVFHELCLQQWFEYCPVGKKSSCPVCKQACSDKNANRLYFQSTAESTQAVLSQKNSESYADAEELRDEVKRLEAKILGLNVASERQQNRLQELNEELSITKDRAKKEEALREHLRLEKASIGQLLQLKTEELNKMFSERFRLQERCMALAKELATLKLVSDVNLDEEKVSKLASLGGGANKDETADILKKALILRNQKYKELMAQCNELGRGETLSRRKLEKAQEKIKTLKMRLQELEKALEENENEVLRALKASNRTKNNDADITVAQVRKSVNPTARSIQSTSQNSHLLNKKKIEYAAGRDNDLFTTIIKEDKYVTDLDQDIIDPCYLFDEDETRSYPLVHQPSGYSEPLQAKVSERACLFGQRSPAEYISFNGDERNDSKKIDKTIDEDVMIITHQNSAAENLLPDVTLKDARPLPIKRGAPGGLDQFSCPGDQCFSAGLPGPEGEHRYLGKWCRRSQNKVSSSGTNGDLISVGADGRGGTIKVLRSQNKFSDGKGSSLWPKRSKYGAKQSDRSQGCLQIDHYFVKRDNS